MTMFIPYDTFHILFQFRSWYYQLNSSKPNRLRFALYKPIEVGGSLPGRISMVQVTSTQSDFCESNKVFFAESFSIINATILWTLGRSLGPSLKESEERIFPQAWKKFSRSLADARFFTQADKVSQTDRNMQYRLCF